MRRIVIVGNGIAGLTAADSLRAAGHDGQLTIVGDERHAAYSRPALSKAMLHGDDLTAHHLPASAHRATELLGVTATALDPGARTVALGDGSTLPYDALVIATGSRARRIGDDAGELTLRTLDDAIALRARLGHRPSVAVVGGGALGMEVASSCLAAGCPVTLVSRGRPLLHQLGPYLADMLVTAALQRGLALVETRVARLRRDGAATRVIIDKGKVLEADVVVTAVGDLQNVEWLATSELLRGGVLEVDSRGRVRPDIVAVGDVAAFPTRRGVRRVPLWTSAIEQGRVAAVALVRGDEAPALDFRPYFWTEQFGLTLKAAGFLPLAGPPSFIEGDGGGPALMRWTHPDGSGTAVALNYRIPIPRLRRIGEATAA